MTGAQYRLVVRQGPNTGRIIELDKSEIFIGRDIANDIVFNDAEVSRKHARLTLEGDRYTIEDLTSTNGTYVNGQRLIGPHVLAIGEIIMFGDNIGVIFDGEPAATDVTVPSTIDLGITPVSAIPAPVETYIQPALPPIPQSSIPSMDNISIPQQSPMEVQPEQLADTDKKPINSWLLAGCGCILVIIVLVVALWVFIDQPWNPGGGLYCVSPFDLLFKSIGYCP